MGIISTEQIKILRERTGAGIAEVKKALEESGGETEKAVSLLERKLGNAALKKAGRDMRAGLIESYIHANGKIGSMVEIFCETDFVARNPQFKEFAHGLAMHIAAMNPLYLSFDAIPAELLEAERSVFLEEAERLGKPNRIVEEIVNGKLKAHFGPLTFLLQPFIKDQDKTIGEIVNEAIGRFGENIKIGRFVRFEL
jgi:elongation factor Ts